MSLNMHGISIGIERYGDDDFFVTMKAVGKLTHEDYEYMVPMLESAIAGVKDPDIYALLDVTEWMVGKPEPCGTISSWGSSMGAISRRLPS